jgi:thiol:disulfide interchange protein
MTTQALKFTPSFTLSPRVKHVLIETAKFALVLGVIALMMHPLMADASGSGGGANTGNTALQDVYDWLKGLATGTGGMLISLAVFVIGLIVGAIRTTAIYALAGFVFAILFKFGPDMLETIMGAGIQAHHLATLATF